MTGSRADYGLLRHLALNLAARPNIDMKLLVTGAHLSHEHGMSCNEIEADGVPIAARIPILEDEDDTPTATAKALSKALVGTSQVFDDDRPDILVVLGDRYEILGPVQAAMLGRIPIAHIHGGEATHGIIDDVIRNAVTKIAHLHFVSRPEYRSRIIQMGENPTRVWDVGPMAVDAIRTTPTISREELLFKVGLPENTNRLFAVTYHPLTLDPEQSRADVCELIAALSEFPDVGVVFSMPNADPGRNAATEEIRSYVDKIPSRRVAVTNLGHPVYLNLLRQADLCIGNSSSGIIEAPLLGVPSVNIGERQAGRITEPSTLTTRGDRSAIRFALSKVSSPPFRAAALRNAGLLNAAQPASDVADVLCNTPLEGILAKRFKDLQWNP